jgi:hypothetical protein
MVVVPLSASGLLFVNVVLIARPQVVGVPFLTSGILGPVLLPVESPKCISVVKPLSAVSRFILSDPLGCLGPGGPLGQLGDQGLIGSGMVGLPYPLSVNFLFHVAAVTRTKVVEQPLRTSNLFGLTLFR